MKIYLKKFLLGQVTLIFTLAYFALSPHVRATCQEGCDLTNDNTFLGDDALLNNTTGSDNTAIGFNALFNNTTGFDNTANGADSLFTNTTGSNNTAYGLESLFSNTTGSGNTATGVTALFSNTTGNGNTANGIFALYSNTNGYSNTADGYSALYHNTGNENTANGFAALNGNTTGIRNTACGLSALAFNTIGSQNTANGANALFRNTTGTVNVAIGYNALFNNTTGGSNTALGPAAGSNLTTGSNNIDIANKGVRAESNSIRIGTQGTQTTTHIAGISGTTVAGGVGVLIDTTGQLGTITSSARYKEGIKPMDKVSEAILALKPVTFRYKHELDPNGIPQFGLVAEEVEKVNSDLVARDEQGKPYTVRYEAVNAMLLNEFLKEHRKVEEQQATIAQLKAADAKQEDKISALTELVKAQGAQLQKVSAQLAAASPFRGGLEASIRAQQTVVSNP